MQNPPVKVSGPGSRAGNHWIIAIDVATAALNLRFAGTRHWTFCMMSPRALSCLDVATLLAAWASCHDIVFQRSTLHPFEISA